MPSTVVIDNGSLYLKTGYAGEDMPKHIFTNVIGQPRFGGNEIFFGEEALKKRSILSMKYPIFRGTIGHLDDMENMWNYTFHEILSVSPEDHPVLLTYSPLTSKIQLEKMAMIMFEIFKTPAVYLANQAVLSLHASGRKTGVVLESGHGSTHAVPVYNGKALKINIGRLLVGGLDLTDYMGKLLAEEVYGTASALDQLIVRQMKESLCYVAYDFKDEIEKYSSNNTEKSFYMEDGQEVKVGNQMFRCPEVLFRPNDIGSADPGIHQLINNAILETDEDVHKEMYANILLSGGNTMFPGLAKRLKKEIAVLANPDTEINILAPPDRNIYAWRGGSMVASLSTFPDMWISKQEWEENGPSIVDKFA